MSAHSIVFVLTFTLIFLSTVTKYNEATLSQENATLAPEVEELVPLMDEGKVQMMLVSESRRNLGSFQICALCTCCGGTKGVCLPSPCCYAINCNIPNRPFGFCAFTPKTCNCFGCHI